VTGIRRQEWFTLPAETDQEKIVLALLARSSNGPDFDLIVEEPIGETASVGVSFTGESWKPASDFLHQFQERFLATAATARQLMEGEDARGEETCVSITERDRLTRFAVTLP
jgi:hypothetical protein